MRYIKTYGIWEGSNNLTPEQANFLNEHIKGTWSVNLDGEVDVKGDFDCSYKELEKMPVRFGLVSGNFWCENNQLTTLEGSPRKVVGTFDCGDNLLTSLEGAPREVSENFWCGNNRLTTLVGAPKKVGGGFWCGHNRLTSLKGAPQELGSIFDCENNQLISLEGAPQKVGVDFRCTANPIGENTLRLLFEYMQENPDLHYGAVLLALRNKIPSEDWNKLDKSAIDRLSDKAQKGYKLLGGIGGI